MTADHIFNWNAPNVVVKQRLGIAIYWNDARDLLVIRQQAGDPDDMDSTIVIEAIDAEEIAVRINELLDERRVASTGRKDGAL